MNQRAIIMTIVLFTLIIIGMFVFAFLKKEEMKSEPIPDQVEQVSEVKYASITRIDAKHYYIDGVHTLVGEITMPTPCELLDTEVEIAESYPEQVFVDFNIINNSENCIQVLTPARFKVEAAASKEASFSAKLNGRKVELNLIPALEGEKPDDFELFLKG